MKKIKVINALIKRLHKMKERIFPSYQMNEREKTVYSIIENILKSPETIFKIAPLSSSYFISNETLQYNIKISDKEIIIVNHAFSFTRCYALEFHELLMNLIGTYVEKDRLAFEKEIFQGELEVLKNIEQKVKKAK